MHHKSIRTLVMAGCLASAGLLALAGTALAEPASESMLSNTCAGCHGTDGVAAGPAMPSIANMDAKIMENLLMQFKSGERPSTIMGRIATGYEDAELKAIAQHFSKLPWKSTAVPTDPKLVAEGAKLHKSEKCNSCHEEDGRTQSAEDGVMRQAGQIPHYLFLQMVNYQKQEYPDVPKKMMSRLSKLSEKDLQALAHFYASQK
ncbi:MAG: cytochrome c, class I [Magnetococcales bacterium]|nr:cytochrome c, class I [Magnetococcales bacterium]MBF0156674.1 cytochrome c, class I [Magnetococcales bacterium]